MTRFLLPAIATLCFAAAQSALGQDKSPAATIAPQPRGVYAAIDLRPAQKMIQRLGVAYGSDRRAAIKEVLNDPSAYMPPVLYALANTLSEDHPEDAIFWYHVGRMRAVYDALRCRDKSANAGLLDLRRRISQGLASSQFYRRERLVGIAERAIDWDAKNPRKYDHRWIALYGKVAATSPGNNPDELTVAESEWPAILKYVHETHLKSVKDFVAEKKSR